jgi:ankyrin repeat protein
MARTKPGAKMNAVKREPDSEVRRELRSACKADNIQRVAELLGNGAITAADATACLEETWQNLPLMRLLLEHGADPATCATTRCMRKSIELIKLLVEFGCDITGTGHWVLQFVIPNQERMQILHG